MREHSDAVKRLDFMPRRGEITAAVPAGSVEDLIMHDGGTIRVRRLAPDCDPHVWIKALNSLEERRRQGEVVTGPI